MKKYLLGAAAILTIAAPATAFAHNGYVGATYSNVDSDSVVGDDDSWGIDGALAFGGQGGLGFEVDAGLANPGDADDAWGVGGHVFGRTDGHLLGVFAAYTDADEASLWSAGVEGEKYFTNWTLAGAISYGSSDDLDADAWGVDGQLRYFVTDNLRLQGSLGWTSVDAGDAGDADVTTYGLGGEWQINTTPLSLLAGWTHADSGDLDADADIFSLGFRVNFGGSLKDRDRHGASLAGLSGVSSALGL